MKYQIPQVDFTSFKYAGNFAPGINGEWTQPSQAVEYVVSKIMSAGQIPQIRPPAPNATWTLDFWGPGLRCIDASEDMFGEIFVNIWNSYRPTQAATYDFLSWVPWSQGDYEFPNNETFFNGSRPAAYLPFLYGTHNISESDVRGIKVVPQIGPSTASSTTDGPLSLYIAVLPRAQDVQIGYDYNATTPEDTLRLTYFSPTDDNDFYFCQYEPIKRLSDSQPNCSTGYPITRPPLTVEDTRLASKAFENAALLQCSMINTSHSVEFEFLNGQQNIRAASNKTIHPDVLNGSLFYYSNALEGSFDTQPSLQFDVTALRLISYQSIMAAFNEMITGSITRLSTDSPAPVNTTILRTVLRDANELAFIKDLDSEAVNKTEKSGLSPHDIEKFYPGLGVSSPLTSARGPLGAMIEELFQNLTLSLTAEPYFQ